MELLLQNSVLCRSKISISLLVKNSLLLLKLMMLVGDILIFDFDDILFILINDANEFPLYLYEVLINLVFIEVEHFLFGDEICINLSIPERMSMS
jgi:hypothetical protein